MKPIVTGVLGYGFSGRIFHCPFIDAHEHFELKTVVQRHANTAKDDYPYIHVAKDYQELLDDEEIELVVITTPSHLHFEHAKQALEKNKHVLIEKPYTATYEQAVELNRIADEKNLFISAYQNRRYDGDFLTLSELKKQGMIEKLYEVSMVWDFNYPVQKENWREQDYEGANFVFDLGAHFIDQALHLFGEPKDLYSISKKVREGSKVDDWFEVLFDYGDYVARIKHSCAALIEEPRYTIQTNQGTYQFHKMGEQEPQLIQGVRPLDPDYGDNSLYDYYKLDGTMEKRRVIKGNYLMFYTQMARAIRLGEQPEVTKESAAKVIQYLERIANANKAIQQV